MLRPVQRLVFDDDGQARYHDWATPRAGMAAGLTHAPASVRRDRARQEAPARTNKVSVSAWTKVARQMNFYRHRASVPHAKHRNKLREGLIGAQKEKAGCCQPAFRRAVIRERIFALLRQRERAVDGAPGPAHHGPHPDINCLARFAAKPLSGRLAGIRQAPERHHGRIHAAAANLL